MSEILNGERVEEVMKDCLYTTEEVEAEGIEGHVAVEGIMANYGFHPKKLARNEEAIVEMLSELPVEFRKSGAGGWSFLNACDDKDGNQWTGLHSLMEALFVLGMAIGKVVCPMEREYWESLPGGMPYYTIEM